jgi:hypothetical protein
MNKTQTISPETMELIKEVASATASMAYIDNIGGDINYFRATESLLYNYKKLEALMINEEAYLEVEYHEKSKSLVSFSPGRGYQTTDVMDELRQQRIVSYKRTKARFDEIDRVIKMFRDREEFPVVQMYYFKENLNGEAIEGGFTFEDIADELERLGLARTEKTARRWRNRIVNDIAVCLFGKPAAVGSGIYKKGFKMTE